jgi:hypothetical protein
MEYRWSIQTSERDFDGLNWRYDPEPSKVAYEEVRGMRPRSLGME